MLLADISLSTEAVVVITVLLTAVTGALVQVFRMYDTAREREYKRLLEENEKDRQELEATKKSYAEIANEAVVTARKTTDFYRAKEGLPPIPVLAPVVSESHSDSTLKQREVAKIATLRAQMAAVKLAEGQEPREEPPHAVEPGQTPMPGAVAPIAPKDEPMTIKLTGTMTEVPKEKGET